MDIGAVNVLNIHYVHVFHAQKHLAGYINQCRELRNQMKSKNDKNIFKLFSNAVYGKQLQNVLNFDENIFVSTKNLQTIRRYNNHPLFKSRTIINEDNVLYHRAPDKIKLDQAIFVGKSILDLSKWVMFNFYYNQFMPIIRENNLKCQLLFTDTDSLAFEVFTDESAIKTDVELFKAIHSKYKCLDFSEWPEGHELHFKETELDSKHFMKKPFSFGSEFKPETLDDTNYRPDTYIGLRAKQYMFSNTKSGEFFIKSKGIPSNMVKKYIKDEKQRKEQEKKDMETGIQKLTIKDFSDIVDLKKDNVDIEYNTLQSKDNIYKTFTMTKRALCPFDDKIYYKDPYNFEYFGSYNWMQEMKKKSRK